jgi:ABC-type nitrate/sulfonate/bicarbonate transport system substrate-binding protein
MKIAIPDLISNSYFPAAAAVELGFFKEEGLDMELELIFPVDHALEVMRDGGVDFVGGSAHSVPHAFPEWKGAKVLASLAQGMYWFLIMRADLKVAHGDISCVKGRTIGAAPLVDLGLKQLLIESGIDLDKDEVNIAPVPGAFLGENKNFGVAAAKALEAGLIDGFWANGMGAEVAVKRGAGTMVLDARRGDGPASAFNYTMPALITTDRLIADTPDVARAAIRALKKTHAALREDVSRATEVGRKLFPAEEAELIADVVARDLDYYDVSVSREFVAGMSRFSQAQGLTTAELSYDQVVNADIASEWD